MTQTEQTTAERIQALIDESFDRSTSPPGVYSGVAETIAAEIDAKDAQLAEARAQIAALTPKAEAWDAWEKWQEAQDTATVYATIAIYREGFDAAAARAREVAA